MTKTNSKIRGPSGQRGFVLVTAILSTPILLAFCGLAVDVGYLCLVKTRMQTAADAAALGGVQELRMNGSSTIVTAAKGDAAHNGFTDGQSSVTITVNHPPLSGYYTADQTAIEVIVSQSAPTFFMQILGFSAITVTARAVAHQGSGSTCVYVLDPSATKALWETGSGDLASPCGVWVDSNDPKAVYQTASAKIVTTPANTDIVGSYYQTGSSSITPSPITGVSPPSVVDPLASRTMPTLPGSCDYTNKSVSSTTTLNPGVYCGGLSITGSGTTTFNPGLYIMNGGGFNIAGSGNANGSGITVYLTWDSSHTYKGISVNGSGTYTLSAPTSGTYESLLFMGDRTKASGVGSTITGTSSLLINGVVYLPKEALTFTGGSSSTNYQVIVADTLKLTGLTYLNNNYSSLSSGPPIRGGGVVSE